MGAYSPTRLVPPEILEDVMARVIRPAVAGLAAEGRPFTGFLYAGLLFTRDGVQLVEFNARYGDPEAQAVLPLLESDLIDLLEMALDRRLRETPPGGGPRWSPGASCAVCLASAGYPDAVRDGVPVEGLERVTGDAVVFHAGTVRRAGETVTKGGRVLAVTSLGADLAGARRAAYANVERISFEGMQYRRDIGAQEANL
jgi:phosphoribosylamine--glycine ligase